MRTSVDVSAGHSGHNLPGAYRVILLSRSPLGAEDTMGFRDEWRSARRGSRPERGGANAAPDGKVLRLADGLCRCLSCGRGRGAEPPEGLYTRPSFSYLSPATCPCIRNISLMHCASHRILAYRPTYEVVMTAARGYPSLRPI